MEIMFDNVSYRNLKKLSFMLNENKITFIVGESGSGKSTLLSLINGDICDYNGNIVRENVVFNKIGFLRQNYADYFCFNTIYEEIAFYLKKKRIRNEKQVIMALKMVGLDESFLNRSPFKISKGEQKKLALAILLAQKFKVFLLDEPFTNLDDESKKNMIKLFRVMKLKYGKTIVIATTDTDTVLSLADEVIGLNNGKVIFKGDKFELFTNKKLIDDYNINEPEIIRFTNLIKDKKNVKMGYRDDINDLMKDIYRFVK